MEFVLKWLSAYLACCCHYFTIGKVFSPEFEDELDQYIDRVMACRHIPGLTLTVVKSGETWTRGYGEADLATNRPVDNETKFLIASLTKAFTATVLGKLLEEKGYKWETPVADILGKNYTFVDDQRTSYTTIKDLLSHRTGLANPDIVAISGYPHSGFTRQDLCMRSRFIPAEFEFRDKWYYNNYMYMYAGCIVEKLANKSWEDVVKSRLFDPIGMTSSDVQVTRDTFELPGIALPYIYRDGYWINGTTDTYSLSPLEPAGSISSTGKDMGKWLRFLLRKGVTDAGQRLVREDLIEDMMTTHISFDSRDNAGFHISKPNFPIGYIQIGYGYAWFTSVYRGYKKIHHSGGYVSYISRIWIFPDMETAIFISVNVKGSNATLAELVILHFISDKLLGLNSWLNETTACSYPFPWDTSKDISNNTDCIISNVTVEELSQHVGKYGSHVWGDVTIDIPNGGNLTLILHINRFVVGTLHPVNKEGGFLFQQTLPHEQQETLDSPALIECSFQNSCKNCNRGTFVMKTKQGTITFYKNVNFSDQISVTEVFSNGRGITGICISILSILITATIRSGFI